MMGVKYPERDRGNAEQAIDKSVALSQMFDAIVMLTFSNWQTEMRSNRYHYAARFARDLPVIFVQPDLDKPHFAFEGSEISGVVLLHIDASPGLRRCRLLKAALEQKGVHKPLLWVYSHSFIDFLALCYGPVTVYHASEDYFSPAFKIPDEVREKLRKVLRLCDLVVAVSEGVRESFVGRGNYQGEALVIPNGCDAKFWAPSQAEHTDSTSAAGKRVAFYQGGIHRKIDFALMDEVVGRLPDWEFWFCGEVYPGTAEWESLCRYANVKYFGKLKPTEVRDLAHRSTVGLIPFVQNELIIERSFPLKAFEYLAAGLPVVTVPIKALLPHGQVFAFAATPAQFVHAITTASSNRHEPQALERRLRAARAQDYDVRFETLISSEAFKRALTRPTKAFHGDVLSARLALAMAMLWQETRRRLRPVVLFLIRLGAHVFGFMVRKDPDHVEQSIINWIRKRRGVFA
jgi:glycosyltransferase involved in cell wall biosynthesis